MKKCIIIFNGNNLEEIKSILYDFDESIFCAIKDEKLILDCQEGYVMECHQGQYLDIDFDKQTIDILDWKDNVSRND